MLVTPDSGGCVENTYFILYGTGLPARSTVSTTTPDQSRTESLFKKLKRLPKRISAKPDAESVHALRTTIRRVETLLEVTSNGSGRAQRKLKKHMDRVRRRAGKVRDIDVQIKALETVKIDAVRDEKMRVLQALRRSRAKREGKLLIALEEEMDSGMAKHLVKAADRLAENGHESGSVISASKPDPRAVVAHALEAFRDAVERHGTLTEQNLHPFRLACKHVRYIAEMAGRDVEAERIVKRLKRVQDAIGEWHDWVTLSATAVKVLGKDSSPLISAIRTNSRSKFLNAVRIADETKRTLLAKQDAGTARKPPQARPPAKAEGSTAETAATA
jgi:CHAD domain-containing protein